MRDFRKCVAIFLLLVFVPSVIFAADASIQIEPYHEGEFPDWLLDVRRAEIVSLGSLPFTTLSCTLIYSFYRYAANNFDKDYFPNPLAKSSASANLTKEEQIGIISVSAGLSLTAGIIDYIISSSKRTENRKQEEEKDAGTAQNVTITPLPMPSPKTAGGD